LPWPATAPAPVATGAVRSPPTATAPSPEATCGWVSTVVVTSLTAFDVIHPSLGLAIGAAALLLLLDVSGWRLVSLLLDRERLITGTR